MVDVVRWLRIDEADGARSLRNRCDDPLSTPTEHAPKPQPAGLAVDGLIKVGTGASAAAPAFATFGCGQLDRQERGIAASTVSIVAAFFAGETSCAHPTPGKFCNAAFRAHAESRLSLAALDRREDPSIV